MQQKPPARIAVLVTKVNQLTCQAAFGLWSNRPPRYRAAWYERIRGLLETALGQLFLVTDKTSLIEGAERLQP